MENRVQVRRVVSIAEATGRFRFHVELTCAGRILLVAVNAQELLDFDRFQTATLEQTGRLVMPPCGPGAEGPDHYRRHRRVWCDELQAAVWEGPQATGLKPSLPAASSPVPAPKTRGLASESQFRHS